MPAQQRCPLARIGSARGGSLPPPSTKGTACRGHCGIDNGRRTRCGIKKTFFGHRLEYCVVWSESIRSPKMTGFPLQKFLPPNGRGRFCLATSAIYRREVYGGPRFRTLLLSKPAFSALHTRKFLMSDLDRTDGGVLEPGAAKQLVTLGVKNHRRSSPPAHHPGFASVHHPEDESKLSKRAI